MKNISQKSQTAQNRLIIFGLVFSTLLIMAIAVFAASSIQKNLTDGYHSFGQVIAKTLAVETADLIKNSDGTRKKEILKTHSDLILNSNKNIVYIEFRDKNGKILYKAVNKEFSSNKKSNISVSSPMTDMQTRANEGSVTVGLSDNIVDKLSSTTRASIMFVFIIVWLVFAFVVLINNYLITRELKIFRDGVKRISSKEFGVKIESEEVSDEVKELFNAFNEMSNKLHIYEESNVEQLTLERNKLKAVLMSIANGVIVCDNNDQVTLINEHAKQLLELQGDQLLNTNIKNYVDSDGNFCFSEKIDEYKNLSLEERASKPVIFNIKLDDKMLKSVISPMFTQNHDYVGYIIVMIDVTREAEMDVMRSQFISNVSHELRTPVTVLRSYIDTLYDMGSDFDYEAQKEFIGTLHTEIVRLQNMVNDILDFSRLE